MKAPPRAGPKAAKKSSSSTDARKRADVRPRRMPRGGRRRPGADSPPVPIVAVGASAGGFEAFSQLLEGLGASPGIAMVLIQHLSPQHESMLSTQLASHTPMPVVQAEQSTVVESNHVYVIPPNTQMEIVDHRLRLSPRPDDRTQHTPIDVFFRSLAESSKNAAIGVVLSGASSDGAIGLRDIKGVGGITFAQDPRTALHDAMPRAAIATGAVDLVLSPAEIAAEVRRIGADPYVHRASADDAAPGLEIDDAQFRRLVVLLRNASGIDFGHYKTPTIKRRLHRRMLLQRMTDVGHYLRLLQTTPAEAQRLSQDILIHVTRFFRDPDAFAALVTEVFPELLANRPADSPVRVWVPGCATGEEAYSIAIALLEFLGEEAATTPLQIFATDVSETAIEQARLGIYPLSISVDVSADRLRRFFTKSGASYRINKLVRELCVFARQDLTRDPPFSKLDLVVCRNVLIYLGAPLQQRLLNVFHYALRGNGFLMLGHAETADSYTELFRPVDKHHRFYRKKGELSPLMGPLPHDAVQARDVSPSQRSDPTTRSFFQAEAQRLLLERYAPPGVVVDDDLSILQFLGHTGRYLEPSPGEAKLSLPKMLRDGLLHGLRTAFHQARREGRPIRRTGLQVHAHGQEIDLALEVIPFGAPSGKDRRYLVLFEENPVPAALAPAGKRRRRGAKDPRVAKLEQELAATRDYLQSIIQELEAANEELQAANEEMLSSAEELQSTNEELDTAKEELQSTNEELSTMNEELHGRNDELSRVNSDLVNLLNSVPCALVIVQSDLRIRRFTPNAEPLLNLRASDVGRPIGHIKPNIDCPELEQIIHTVIDAVSPQEREVRDAAGRWMSLQVRPYKSADNRVEGAVLTMFDIDAAKRAQLDLHVAREVADAVIETVGDGLAVLDEGFRIERVNRAFCELFRVAPVDVTGKRLFDIRRGEWDLSALRDALAGIHGTGESVEGFEIPLTIPGEGVRTLSLSARKIEQPDARPPLVLLAVADRGR